MLHHPKFYVRYSTLKVHNTGLNLIDFSKYFFVFVIKYVHGIGANIDSVENGFASTEAVDFMQ